MAIGTKAKDRLDELAWSSVDPAVMENILRENWWLIALRGILGIAFGIVALLFPIATILSLVLLFSAYMLVDGAFSIVAAIRAGRRGERWGWLLANGILSLVTGALAFLWPGITALAFVIIVAAWSVVWGSIQLVSAFRLRRRKTGKGWLIFGGVMSILFGILLTISPLIGAIVLTWWLGAFVFASSIVMLIVAFQSRSKGPKLEAPGTPAPSTG